MDNVQIDFVDFQNFHPEREVLSINNQIIIQYTMKGDETFIKVDI